MNLQYSNNTACQGFSNDVASYRGGNSLSPTEGGRSTSNEGGPAGGATDLWEGIWLIENQYTYVFVKSVSVTVSKC